MKKAHALSAFVVIAVMALSGCIRQVCDVTLSPDGTVSGEFVSAYHEAYLEASGMTEEDLFSEEEMDAIKSELSNAEVYDYDQDLYVGRRVTFEGQTIDDFTVGDAGSFSRDGDDFIFQGSLIDDPSAASLRDSEPAAYSQLDFRLSITFPGEVYEHNGSLSGTTVTWDKDAILSGEEPYARGSASPGVVIPTGEPEDDVATPRVDVSPTGQGELTEVHESDNGSDSDLWKGILIGWLGAVGFGFLWWGVDKLGARAKG